MVEKNPWILYYGQNSPPTQTTFLRAGAFTLIYDHESGDLRRLKYGDFDLLCRIYVAVRDANWNTIPAQITMQELSLERDSFRIRYKAEHQQEDIHFTWDGEIVGGADSMLTFSMSGRTQSTFMRNRIGFCVLHPMACAGVKCTIEHVDGNLTEGIFPVEIAPYQPFLNMRAITQQVSAETQVKVQFSGEVFEMEDQRNWTDASYKTYGTPLALSIPVEIQAGTHVQQSVTLSLIGDTRLVLPVEQNAQFQVIVTDQVIGRLPRLGLSSAEHGQPLSKREIERFRLLRLTHLHTDVCFSGADWQQRLEHTIDEVRRLDVALEVALHLSAEPETNLAALQKILNQHPIRVARWLLFQEGQVCTPSGIATLARQYLSEFDPNARFAGGTDAFFVQLNRERPAVDGLDLLTYSLSPQVHAFDNITLVENLAAQSVTLRSGRNFSEGRGLIVSPVTFRLRHNPAALGEKHEPEPGTLPPQVDPRQASLFGAGWTLGSIKYLSEGGAESVTYYETTGWLGVMEREAPNTTFALFPSKPGEVFPLFHVLADTGEFRGGEVLHLHTTDSLRVDGLALRQNGQIRLLLANFTATVEAIDLKGIRGEVDVRIMDETNVAEAMRNPEAFRAQAGKRLTATNEGLRLELAPFAVAQIDGFTGEEITI